MTNTILEILENNHPRIKDNMKSAKEIADMMKEFIKWFDINTSRATSYSFMYYLNSEMQMNVYQERSIDDLFDYWHENIYKK